MIIVDLNLIATSCIKYLSAIKTRLNSYFNSYFYHSTALTGAVGY